MSKKRKTRSQKEKAVLRKEQRIEHAPSVEKEPLAPSYTVKDIKPVPQKEKKEKEPIKTLPDFYYQKKDMKSIAAATGIIIAFNILLFTLLSTGVLRLGFLGY